jgi:D-tyrosyl-tRNA(Tyr) deacylase
MKLVITRVNSANVKVNDVLTANISRGLLILVSFSKDFTESKLDYMVRKVLNLRLFNSLDKGFDLSVSDIGSEILVVSQFTLHGVIDGNKPNFKNSLDYDAAKSFYEQFVNKLREESNLKIETGKFGEMMEIGSINDGPVTIILEK